MVVLISTMNHAGDIFTDYFMTGQYGDCNYSDDYSHTVGGICLLQTIMLLNVVSCVGTRDKYVSFCHETLGYLCFGANTTVVENSVV